MRRVYLYCDPRSLNDATSFYVGVVEDCLRNYDCSITRVNKLSEIHEPDIIFTITSPYYCKAKVRFPFAKTIKWFQGVVYEEAQMNRAKWKWPLLYISEYSVNNADFVLFVSQKMKEYYSSHFGYKGNNYVIMPCFNLLHNDNCNLSKFESPTFVYAGGVSEWQSIDKTLDTYAVIERHISDARLTLLCKEKEYLMEEITKRGINNYEIKYVSLEQLQDELENYKYGFIIREKNWVNEVATPTKMNSYLAAHIIPIFSDGVNDFEQNINLGDFTLMAKTPLNPKDIADSVIRFENQEHDYESYLQMIYNVFKKHYNLDKYKQMINEKIKELVI